MNMKKRADGAPAAATLLAIIMGLIVLYVLFIPPAERAKLLGDDSTTTSMGSTTTKGLVLLKESPGRVDFLPEDTNEHALPAVYIFIKKEGAVFGQKPLTLIKNSLFSSKSENIYFDVYDLENTENVLLSASVKKSQGELVLTLNGEEIFSSFAETGAITPLKVPKGLLKETGNLLEISVSSPGIAFWRTNEYNIENVQIVGDVQRVETQKAKSSFLVSETEKNNLEKAEIKMSVDCQMEKVGKLRISLNNEQIYAGIPDCGSYLSTELSPDSLKKGSNEMEFFTESGSYYLSLISLKSQLKEVDFPTYYFELSEEQFSEIEDNKKEAVLTLNFVDSVDKKQADVLVNGHMNNIDQKGIFYNVSISDDVVKGTNSVKVKPKKSIEIKELKVDLK